MEPHTGLNNLDFVVFGILFLSAGLALFRGFVREVLSVVSWLIAYFAAVKYYHLAEPWAHHHIKNVTGAALAAGTGIFLVALLLCAIISSIIVGLVRGKTLNAVDRSLGFAFGLLRGALVICMVYLAVSAMMWPDADKPADQQPKDAAQPPDWVIEAKTRPWLVRGAMALKTFIPEKDIKSATAKLDEQFNEQKKNAQKEIDQQTLDNLSVPKPVSKNSDSPAYDDKNRSNLDKLINQKSNP